MNKIFFLIIPVLLVFSCSKKQELSKLADTDLVMQRSIESLSRDNQNLTRRIEKEIIERGNKPDETYMKDKALGLRNRSKLLIGSISEICDSLIGGNEDRESLPERYLKSVSLPYSFIEGLKGNFSADSIPRDSLNMYIENLSQHLPLVLRLINLRCIQWKVLGWEKEQLEKIFGWLDNLNAPFNKPKVVVKPYSNIVEEGDDYSAEILMTGTQGPRSFVRRMTVEGKDIPVDSNGIGQVNFLVKADQFNKEGLCKKTWKGSVTFPTLRGDTSLTAMSEYYIKKRCSR